MTCCSACLGYVCDSKLCAPIRCVRTCCLTDSSSSSGCKIQAEQLNYRSLLACKGATARAHAPPLRNAMSHSCCWPKAPSMPEQALLLLPVFSQTEKPKSLEKLPPKCGKDWGRKHSGHAGPFSILPISPATIRSKVYTSKSWHTAFVTSDGLSLAARRAESRLCWRRMTVSHSSGFGVDASTMLRGASARKLLHCLQWQHLCLRGCMLLQLPAD